MTVIKQLLCDFLAVTMQLSGSLVIRHVCGNYHTAFVTAFVRQFSGQVIFKVIWKTTTMNFALGRVDWYPARAAASVQPAYPT